MSLLIDIEKTWGNFHLKVNLTAGEETLALLGPSGCGKSMTLKCIAGIETPDRGKILVDGITWFDSEQHINLSPQKRHTGLMFQNYALFPNMTVLQNLQAGTRRKAKSHHLFGHTASSRDLIFSMLENFGLLDYANHYPHQLSGGQQQRVALARILLSDPSILLLDEPFSALDSHLRFHLEQEVRQVLRSFGKTALLVSHDRDEVYRLAQRIAIMDQGRIQTSGTQKEVFANPHTKSGAILTGCKNISDIEPISDEQIYAKDWDITLNVPPLSPEITAIGIRMHDIKSGPGENSILCQVAEEIENPFSYTILLRPAGQSSSAPIGWEISKEDWKRLRSQQVLVHLPVRSLLFLTSD